MYKLNILLATLLICFSFQLKSQDFWRPLNGPKGALISSIGVNTEDELFVSLENGNILKSKDKGHTWLSLDDGITSNGKLSGFLSSPDGSIYAIFKYPPIYRFIESIFRIEPHENVWEKVNISFEQFNSFDISIDSEGSLFLIQEKKTFRSMNKGQSFENVLDLSNENFRIENLVCGNNSTSFIILTSNSSKKLYKFNDRTNTFEVVIAPPGIILSTAFDPKDEKLFLTTHLGAFHSLDNGITWIEAMRNRDLEMPPISKIIVSPNDFIYYQSFEGMFCSDDKGINLFPLKPVGTFFRKALKDFVFLKSGEILFLSESFFQCDKQICGISTDNGYSWSEFDVLVNSPPLNNLIQTSSNEMYILSCGSILSSNDEWKTWKKIRINNSNAFVDRLISSKEGTLFAIIEYSTIVKSNNKGLSWDTITPHMDSNVSFFNISLNKEGHLFALSRKDNNRYSTDEGSSWDYFPQTRGIKYIESELFFNNNGAIFHNDNFAFSPSRSLDNGVTWHHMDEKFWAVEIFDFHLSEKGVIYYSGVDLGSNSYASQNGFRVSYNSGESFQDLPYPGKIDSKKVNFITTSNQGHIVIIVDQEVYISYDEGKTWVLMMQGLPLMSTPQEIHIDPSNYLFIVLSNDVIYKSNTHLSKRNNVNGETIFYESTNVQESKNSFKITVSPNPFSYQTNFEIEGNTQECLFQVYDMMGRKLAQKKVWGTKFSFARNGLQNGLYFYRLLKNKEIFASGKMIVN